MRSLLCSCAAVAALALPFAAGADEAEILAHYDAYEAAMSQLRYDVADTEAEAAWRAAEAEWGGIEDTAVLAFNLVRLRLMSDRRAEAVEPALRIVELAGTGNAQSVTAPELALFPMLAQFDGVNAGRGEIADLEDALEAYEPTDYVGKRIALLGWSYAAIGRSRHEQDRPALAASQRALALAAEDPTAPPLLVSSVALVGARAGYNAGEVEEGLLAAKRGVAAFPTQPAGQPIDPALANLLVWDQGLSQLYFMEEQRPYTPTDAALANPAWDDGRYATESGCMVAWAQPPQPSFGGPRPEGIGAVFEYRLNADGSVAEVTQVGSTGGAEHPFAQALREAKAEPPASDACRGPYSFVTAFLMPRS
jgi:hypothetical protein